MSRGPFRLAGIDPDAHAFLSSLPEKIQGQIVEKISFVLEDPYRQGTRQLSGPEWTRDDLPIRRIRSGDYRVLYCVNPSSREVTLLAIGERRDIYGGH